MIEYRVYDPYRKSFIDYDDVMRHMENCIEIQEENVLCELEENPCLMKKFLLMRLASNKTMLNELVDSLVQFDIDKSEKSLSEMQLVLKDLCRQAVYFEASNRYHESRRNK